MTVDNPNQYPLQPSLEAEGMPELPERRFDPAQRRAFGSVPGLLGRELDIPSFEQLDGLALERVSPRGLRRGLLGAEGRNAVDGVVLNAEEYTAIVRNVDSFQAAIQARTASASRANNPVRATEKVLLSGRESFEQKQHRQNAVLTGLRQEQATIDTLLEWQRVPGFSRTSQIDIVSLASQAYNGTFANMLRACKDQYELSPKEYADMQHALAYRLFRGPQNDRVANWGQVLEVAHSYTNAKASLFRTRQQKVQRASKRLVTDLENFYERHGIFEQ